MSTYLQMDGVDDYLSITNIMFDEIILDILFEPQDGVWQYFVDARRAGINNYLAINGGLSGGQASWSAIYADGIQISNATQVPKNKRTILRLKCLTGNGDVYLFSSYSTNSALKGRVYDVKFLLSGVVQAHYDMSTATVLDQSGNGNIAILNGGTWVTDSPSELSAFIFAQPYPFVYNEVGENYEFTAVFAGAVDFSPEFGTIYYESAHIDLSSSLVAVFERIRKISSVFSTQIAFESTPSFIYNLSAEFSFASTILAVASLIISFDTKTSAESDFAAKLIDLWSNQIATQSDWSSCETGETRWTEVIYHFPDWH